MKKKKENVAFLAALTYFQKQEQWFMCWLE